MNNPVKVYDVLHPSPETSMPVTFRASPLHLLWCDVGTFVSHASELGNILRPMPNINDDIKIEGIIAGCILTIGSVLVTGLCLSSFFIGLPSPIVAFTVWAAYMFIGNRCQGRVEINEEGDKQERFSRETWLFVNGVATSRSGLRLILDRLEQLFGRRVIGVHNRTFGFWFDLLECMFQRDLCLPTTDVRVGYSRICQEIQNPAKERVVLMSHSQGGIVMSIWIDQLLADFTFSELRKVEIYNFAPAANHFSNPTAQDGLPTFKRIEHFVNTRDYVALIGLIAFAPKHPGKAPDGQIRRVEGRFTGRIFQRVGQTGHLLLTHYLNRKDSILDDPVVQKYSQLTRYLNGANPA